MRKSVGGRVSGLEGISVPDPRASEGEGEAGARSRRFCPNEFLFYPDGRAKPWKGFWHESNEVALVLSENVSVGKVENGIESEVRLQLHVSCVITHVVNSRTKGAIISLF